MSLTHNCAYEESLLKEYFVFGRKNKIHEYTT